MQPPTNATFLSAKVRVTLDCPECAAPIPINGIVPQVLCAACQTVVSLTDQLGWNRILTYQSGEPCMEHDTLMKIESILAMNYFLAFGTSGGSLYRKWRHILLEVDSASPQCPHCKAALDTQALAREVLREGETADAFCTGCGGAIPIRAPSAEEREAVHPSCVAIVGETALRGDLHAQEVAETVLFSCLGCGAPLDVNATVPRIMKCKYCEATSYMPDALWLRLHPAQRKRPFYLILASTPEAHMQARQAMHS